MIQAPKLIKIIAKMKTEFSVKPHVFEELLGEIKGEGFLDQFHRKLYATDASIYREEPLGVVFPRDKEDCAKIVRWAIRHKIPIIPRAGGTSLAGQVVGKGLVVDISRYMTSILELNAEEGWVRVQPGVIRDELNNYLAPHGWYFGPNTSTANRCMMGGMVGNNSCGSTSIEFGNTRDHVLEMEVVLSDGSLATFGEETAEEVDRHRRGTGRRSEVYQYLYDLLTDSAIRETIEKAYPHPEIKRRNQGYALDALTGTEIFEPESTQKFNMAKLLCGSEGTLAFTTEIKLGLVPLPHPDVVVVCPHFDSIDLAMNATVTAMKHEPSKCELMDRTILELARENPDQLKNSFFVKGSPAALLMIEFRTDARASAAQKAQQLQQEMEKNGRCHAITIVKGEDAGKVWDLRAAGLGVLSNMKGDAKPVACIEDTAVRLEDLPAYIAEFEALCKKHEQDAVFYAHAGAGELHLRPILNLKSKEDVRTLREISLASAQLVKKYGGALSGEHGDGRVRAEFLPLMVGEEVYEIWKEVKKKWDPENIFNPGKIVDAPPMDEYLRYTTDEPDWAYDTYFEFEQAGGMMRVIENCNGTGDCRKLPETGGTMCPSYMATRKEKDSTRGRANIMREYMKGNGRTLDFDSQEVMDVLDLCISCKGCKSECPSNVDMTKLKSEYYAQYYKSHRRPLRDYLILHFYRMYQLAGIAPRLSNQLMKWLGPVIKGMSGFAQPRSLPPVSVRSWKKWMKKHQPGGESNQSTRVYIFIDEFTDVNEAGIGIKTVLLLEGLGYEVRYVPHEESGRAAFSKGFLDQGIDFAKKNIDVFHPLLEENAVLVGVEPSAILSFRDEYPELMRGEDKVRALEVAQKTLTIEEFLWRETTAGNITPAQFDAEERMMALHLHCHYKAMSEKENVVALLSLPENHHVEYIRSGCCGMAGSFGFEKEHYELSQQIGELVVLPAMRSLDDRVIPVAQGTSCRHQVLDGAGMKAFHPVEILYRSLINKENI